MIAQHYYQLLLHYFLGFHHLQHNQFQLQLNLDYFFQTLHQLFMDFYTEQWTAVDLIAERIRAMGSPAPGTYEEFAKLTSIKPSNGLPKARRMIIELVEGQEAVARTARKMFSVAERADDQPTCDLLTQRILTLRLTADNGRQMKHLVHRLCKHLR